MSAQPTDAATVVDSCYFCLQPVQVCGNICPRCEHQRNHLTDGRWHDDCRYCIRRRSEGGTGVPS